ncbi:hypothetical protein [Amycolatopsis sp. Poz14]|uniref:hypothetical protein n=1 Tax=Amycolatopsis sp. Poz14 TaxID=1447705 RepID=UPI001EE7ABE0|nr:hypothetical protein [Amycolatopsis sp. Poz14]MCG3750840.1 hypothetical protein [Amycolatopsis sp. Poz14]
MGVLDDRFEECAVGKKGADDPRAVVRKLMKAGKVKKKCCRSKDRCKKCPVLALKKAKKQVAKAA